VVLRAAEGGSRGVLSTHLHADGTQAGNLYVEGTTGPLRMAGKEVFRHAVNKLSSAVDEVLAANALEKHDVNWLVPHQANIRIIDAMGRKLGLAPDRVVKTVDRHANTSAASVPLALAEAVGDGRIRRGDLVLLEAIGGGLTWGAALVRF
jgi:3-oxoacyl-[acyl-carrier-protein] synthase-3